MTIPYFLCRYASRCLIIEFKPPALSMSVSDYLEIVESQKEASRSIGIAVKLGNEFFDSGIKDIDGSLLPLLKEKADVNVIPRVLPSYAIMLWFSIKVR